MSNIATTYCSGNFTACLHKTLSSWTDAGLEVLIWTDSFDQLEKEFKHPQVKVLELTKEKSSNKRVSCMRKIDTILATINYLSHAYECGQYNSHDGKFVWMDADCYVRKNPFPLLAHVQADVMPTRMVVRDYPYKCINAGVSFWTVSNRAKEFCRRWRKRANELEPTRNLNEQDAFHETCYRMFDQGGPASIAPVSEVLFNCERDKDQDMVNLIKTATPAIIHLKGGRWKRMKDFGL